MDLHAEDLITDRLRLRPLRAADPDWIAKEIANPKVHCWLTSVPSPYAVADAAAFIDRHATDPGYRVITQAGDALGVVSLDDAARDDPDLPSMPELGYWLKEAAWGRGVMTEAARAMIGWHQAIHRSAIYSGWIRGNAASENILRKLGFADLDTIQRHAHFHGGTVTVDRVILAAP